MTYPPLLALPFFSPHTFTFFLLMPLPPRSHGCSTFVPQLMGFKRPPPECGGLVGSTTSAPEVGAGAPPPPLLLVGHHHRTENVPESGKDSGACPVSPGLAAFRPAGPSRNRPFGRFFPGPDSVQPG